MPLSGRHHHHICYHNTDARIQARTGTHPIYMWQYFNAMASLRLRKASQTGVHEKFLRT